MSTAEMDSCETNTLGRDFVLKAAEVRHVKVKSITRKPNETVYCLATEKNGNFIANGIVVKNCDALRYAIMSHFFNKGATTLKAEDIDRMYRESIGGDGDLPPQFQQPRY